MKKHKCPESGCKNHLESTPFKRIIQKGKYYRRSDGQWISRYQCKSCQKRFSSATRSDCYFQKKRKINHKIYLLLCSGVSQRRAAIILGVNRKTVVRKFRFMADQEMKNHKKWLKKLTPDSLSYIQFDDLETAEHSKCKPLSVSLAIEPNTRKILGFQVSQMPARGPLAPIARAKYGIRRDERVKGWDQLFNGLKPFVKKDARFLSDQNPHYPRVLKRHFSKSFHETTPGGRGCIVGQGELKRLNFDPTFSLNHTCAMLRANLNRLFRKTWCTTKTKKGLIDHLNLYVSFHNRTLTNQAQAWGPVCS